MPDVAHDDRKDEAIAMAALTIGYLYGRLVSGAQSTDEHADHYVAEFRRLIAEPQSPAKTESGQ